MLHCNADTPEEMHHWITLLQRSKGDTRVDGQEFIIRGDAALSAASSSCKSSPSVRTWPETCFLSSPSGWLHKEMRNSSRGALKLKKRWFLLTHNSMDYYKSSERSALKLGTLVLNSLCSVVQPDERVFRETGEDLPLKQASNLTAPHFISKPHLASFTPHPPNIKLPCHFERPPSWLKSHLPRFKRPTWPC